MYRITILFVICTWLCSQDVAATCSRIPYDASGSRSSVDENFQILIDGNPSNYIPNQLYNVSLSCPINLKFISFTLVVEGEEESDSLQDKTGHFEIMNDGEMRFRPGCENMLESTNTNPKNRIDVSWIAPSHAESGCVLIKAALVQHRDVWFIDDGFLTKRICPEEVEEINSLTPPLETCCACDEAKYEILLERRWSRNTHAKGYPTESWRTRIGEIIGASHEHSYRYWQYGDLASEGMRELAEHGATHKLEEEIRNETQNGFVRTIIKAPGIPFRENVFGTTLANARVDPKHHQISLSAKIDPSPDWILGVAGLELCLKNCTWLERKVINLYPWDIGIDSGPSYMSSNQPQVPPDVIRRITSSYPNDYLSPFYDIAGAPIKPMGMLYITRKKLYIRECEAAPQEGPLECATHPWNDWSECSTRCGPGNIQRFRSYKNPTLAASYNCERILEETNQCQGTQCGAEFENGNTEFYGQDSKAACRLTGWSNWSPCSTTCGRGIRTRTRDYYNKQAKPDCLSINTLPLQETSSCLSSECGGTINEFEIGNLERNRNSQGRNYQSYNSPGRNFQGSNSQGRNYQSSNIQNQDREQNSQDYNNQYNQGMNSQGQSWSNQDQNSQDYNNQGQNNQDRSSQNQRWSNQDQNSQDYNNQGQNSQNQRWSNQDQNSQDYNNQGQNNLGMISQSQRWSSPDQNSPGGNNPYSYNQGISTQSRITESSSPDMNQDYGSNQRINSFSNNNGYPVSNLDNAYSDEGHYVVQDYCYEMPTAPTVQCLHKSLVISNFWFFDRYDLKCKIFTTDNCDESKNRFFTLQVCLDTCVIPIIKTSRNQGRSNIDSDQGYANRNAFRNYN